MWLNTGILLRKETQSGMYRTGIEGQNGEMLPNAQCNTIFVRGMQYKRCQLNGLILVIPFIRSNHRLFYNYLEELRGMQFNIWNYIRICY